MVSSIDVLRDEYPGDDAWDRYVDAVSKISSPPKAILMLDGLDLTTSQVICSLLGERAQSWWTSPVRALDDCSPFVTFRDNPAGRRILRTLLMRFP
jgi:hypothetical protein